MRVGKSEFLFTLTPNIRAIRMTVHPSDMYFEMNLALTHAPTKLNLAAVMILMLQTQRHNARWAFGTQWAGISILLQEFEACHAVASQASILLYACNFLKALDDHKLA